MENTGNNHDNLLNPRAVEELKEKEFDELFEIIKFVTPGTELRTAIDDISRAGMGALIVLGDSDHIVQLTNGGFKLNCKFSSQQLVELCKMDGAIILSDDAKKIVYCNTMLVPDHKIPTNETGTRHKAAERTAKQINVPIIAVSERRKIVTLYYKDMRYVLRSSEELLSKASETLRMLEKHKDLLNELLVNLNVLEFTNFVSLQDIILPLQRMEIIKRIAETIRKYIIELGTEGNLVKILFKEIIKDVEKEKTFLLKDYSRNWEFSRTALPTLTLDELIDTDNILRILLYSSPNDSVKSRGYRLLNKTNLNKEIISSFIDSFENFQQILDSMNSNPEKIENTLGDKNLKKLKNDLENLKEQALLGKKI
ncbi:DNA integrity scanning diadenylate cyclase DisA [Candidatus Pacearchaeota archaeon]|nr:DNA integrity scanning diadenylate cyclase DisA [Candidatus Pacearchaeota archaeon]